MFICKRLVKARDRIYEGDNLVPVSVVNWEWRKQYQILY